MTSDKRQLNSVGWAAQPQGSGPFLCKNACQVTFLTGVLIAAK